VILWDFTTGAAVKHSRGNKIKICPFEDGYLVLAAMMMHAALTPLASNCPVPRSQGMAIRTLHHSRTIRKKVNAFAVFLWMWAVQTTQGLSRVTSTGSTHFPCNSEGTCPSI
jgi:hypothetical protein